MALPNTIVSGADHFPFRGNFTGPFQSSGGNFYWVGIETTGNTPEVYRATDPESTWTPQDTGNNPTAVPAAMTVFPDGDVLQIVTEESEADNLDLHYHTFDMSANTWGTTDELIETPKDGTLYPACSIATRTSNDSPIVIYAGDEDKVMGVFFKRVDLAHKGASWTVGVDITTEPTVETDFTAAVMVKGASQKLHLFFISTVSGPTLTTLYHRSLTNDGNPGTLSSREAVDAGISLGNLAVAPGIFYDDGGTERIRVPYDNANDRIASAKIDADGSPTTDVDVSEFTSLNWQAQSVSCFAVDGKTVHVMYARSASDFDLYHDSNVDDAGWNATDTEHRSAVTITELTCNVYTRGGNIKLAMVYDNNNVVEYDEIDLGPAPAGPSIPIVMYHRRHNIGVS